MIPALRPPTRQDVLDASRRIAGIAHRTPVFTSRTLDRILGAEVFLKCENFQRTGAFKFRGAYNSIAALSREDRERGVLTYSSGNHAQALALAGRLQAVSVTVVMPSNAPVTKRAATEAYGARVIAYDPETEVREEVAARLREESGMALIPPYDHPHVIAGQGTAALEMLEEFGPLDLIATPCGGGGLLSGTALAAENSPATRIIGVEPELADDAARSLATGTLHTIRNPRTIADGLRTPSLGSFTWPIIRERVDRIVTVSEVEIASAMQFLWTRGKLVVEPSGATAVAGLLRRPDLAADRRIGIILSGGNVDLRSACDIFERLVPEDRLTLND